jgi:hypothetical protein
LRSWRFNCGFASPPNQLNLGRIDRLSKPRDGGWSMVQPLWQPDTLDRRPFHEIAQYVYWKAIPISHRPSSVPISSVE